MGKEMSAVQSEKCRAYAHQERSLATLGQEVKEGRLAAYIAFG